jgi:hypothetical protein
MSKSSGPVTTLINLFVALSVPALGQCVESVVTCDTPVPAVTPAEDLKYTVTVDPHTIWRPVGGEVNVYLSE